MPLKEKINQFAISEKHLRERPEESYHDGTIWIDVVNQDPKLPYWFRQKHPYVFDGDSRLLHSFDDGTFELPLAISGARYERDEHQHVTISLKKKSAIRLMQALKEALDHMEQVEKWHEEHELNWQKLNPIGFAMRKMFNEPISLYENPI